MIGSTLSHFRITAKLGEGGMGEVYRAEDTKLGRDVAIKVLPEAVAADPERLARFEREAKVLASLNHPNIAAIYSIESDGPSGRPADGLSPRDMATDGTGRSEDPRAQHRHTPAERGAPSTTVIHFLVMELVEGEDLKQRLDRGPIHVDEALPIALQIARALEAAHESGIVHRDLKPANIKITPGGEVKVLDFGLAKALDSAPAAGDDLSMSPTLTAQMTQAGVILGTAAYMSPEQAAGEPADRRADIWAFGVVLAEMLTGRPQFDGKTVSHVLAAILKDEPHWDRLSSSAPPAILDLMQHCLRKEPTQRLQAVGDARILIQDYLENPEGFAATTSAPAPAPRSTWQQILPWALFGLAALAFLVSKWSSPAATTSFSAEILKASILPPKDAAFYLAGWNPGPVAVSPDGTKLAFSVQDEDGAIRLYIRSLDSGEAQVLPGTDSAAYPFWAPDSRWLGFFTDVDQTLKRIDTAGGPPVTVCAAENGKGGSWSRDDVILFAPRADTAIYRVPASGGEPEPVTEIDRGTSNSHRHPRFLPDGRHFLYLARAPSESDSVLTLGSLDSSSDRAIVKTPTQGEFAAGHLLFTRGNTLMAQPFDTKRLELTGEATQLVEEILRITGAAMGIFSASDSGVLAFNSGVLSTAVSLAWRDRSGNLLGTVGDPAQFGLIALSPDERQVASVIYDSLGTGAIWLTDVDTGLRSRFTFMPSSNYGFDWSPDSTHLIFSALREEAFQIHRQEIGGVGETELLLSHEDDMILNSVAPDGETLLFWGTRAGTSRDLYIWNREQGGEPTPFRQTEADERFSSFSPDGRWIAYTSNESGRYEIYLAPFPDSGRRWQVSQEGGVFPQWRADGREIVYSQQNGQLMAAAIEIRGDVIQTGAIEPLFRIHPPRPDGSSFAVASDGQRILVWSNKQQQTETVVNLVVNWPLELESR